MIVVDDLHIEASQTFRARDAFRQLTDTLIHEGDLVGAVSTGPSGIALSVSANHTRLASATERITGDGFDPDALVRNFPPDPNGSRETVVARPERVRDDAKSRRVARSGPGPPQGRHPLQ